MSRSVLIIFTLYFFFVAFASARINNATKEEHIKKLIVHGFGFLFHHLASVESRCPGVTQKIKEAEKPFNECVDNLDTSSTLCTMAEPFLLNCTKPIFRIMDDCLPKESTGLAMAAPESAYSIINFLCNEKGETIFELGNPCLWLDILMRKKAPEMEQCEQRTKEMIKEFEKKPLTLRQICTDVPDFKSCFNAQVVYSCKNKITQRAFMGLVNAAWAPCDPKNAS